MGELITLQFGNYANYVGTHFWNIQERNYDYCQKNDKEHEIDSSISWRADERNGLLRYTPRTISIDLKDSKGCLNKEGSIVRERAEVTNQSEVATFMSDNLRMPPSFDDVNSTNSEEPPISPEIEYWSDFLSLDFHPQTIFECSDYKFGIHDFDNYYDGMAFMNNVYEVEEIIDKARKFLEEANSPQGFQIITNTHDGFGAVASGVIENLNDEFSKPTLTFGVSPRHFDMNEQDDQKLIVNTSLSLAGLSKESTVFVPVVMDWNFFANRLKTHKEDTFYHSSAVIAASIDTATLNFRSFTRTADFRTNLGFLSPVASFNIASLSTSFPFEAPALVYTPRPLPTQEPESLSLHTFIPSFASDTVYGQVLSMRGVPLKVNSIPTVKDKLVYLFKIHSRGSNCSVIRQPYESPKTFPCLLYNKPFYPSTVVTQLQSSKGIYPYLQEVSKSFAAIKNAMHNYPDLDFKEMNEELYSKAEGYASSRD